MPRLNKREVRVDLTLKKSSDSYKIKKGARTPFFILVSLQASLRSL
jgi:hypothetical protein